MTAEGGASEERRGDEPEASAGVVAGLAATLRDISQDADEMVASLRGRARPGDALGLGLLIRLLGFLFLPLIYVLRVLGQVFGVTGWRPRRGESGRTRLANLRRLMEASRRRKD